MKISKSFSKEQICGVTSSIKFVRVSLNNGISNAFFLC